MIQVRTQDVLPDAVGSDVVRVLRTHAAALEQGAIVSVDKVREVEGDSILAAPLVLDLVRLAEFAQRKGEAGPMTHLACFFKDPLGVTEQAARSACGSSEK